MNASSNDPIGVAVRQAAGNGTSKTSARRHVLISSRTYRSICYRVVARPPARRRDGNKCGFVAEKTAEEALRVHRARSQLIDQLAADY